MNLHSNIKASPALIPPAAAPTGDTPQPTTVIDRQGFMDLELLIITGTLADAGASWTVLMEQSDVAALASGVTDVADADLLGTELGASFTQAADSTVIKIGYRGSKRYVRATITPSGNAGNAPLAAIWVQAKPSIAPQSTQQIA